MRFSRPSPRRPKSVGEACGFAKAVTTNSNLAYDYDGTITSRTWYWGDNTTSTGNTSSHTYTNPGVYFLRLNLFDNDNNQVNRTQMITVTSSFSEQQIMKKLEGEEDPNEENKNNLASACGSGIGEACYHLGKIYEGEGNTFVYQELMQKACTLGYQQACGF